MRRALALFFLCLLVFSFPSVGEGAPSSAKVRLVVDSPNPSTVAEGYQLSLKADPSDPHQVTIILRRYNTAKTAKQFSAYDNESVFVMTADGPFGFYVHPENRAAGKPRMVAPGGLISKLTMRWSPKPEDQPEQKFQVFVHKLKYHGSTRGRGGVTGGRFAQPTLKFHYEFVKK